MIRFLIQRFFVALVRLAIVWWLLGIATEIVIWLSGETDRHIWHAFADSGMPADFAARTTATFRVLAICWIIVMLLGLGIGIFRARLRRAKILDAIWLPIAGAAWAPAFWLVGLVVIFLVEKWGHPGFADGQLPVGDLENLNRWWHAMILGLILALGAVAWQFRKCTSEIRTEARQSFVRASFMRGHQRTVIFYDHILKNSIAALTGVIDRGLPATLGMLAVAEWAFRYPGLGQLLIESARQRLPVSVFIIAALFATLAILATFTAEAVHGIIDRRARAQS